MHFRVLARPQEEKNFYSKDQAAEQLYISLCLKKLSITFKIPRKNDSPT
jgi:hypothetical protein